MSRNIFKNFEGIYEPGSQEDKILADLDSDHLPVHVAIIMDGNGRWAGLRDLPRVEGHRQGVRAVKAAIETCARLEIKVLTLYAFSAENWKRPTAEVDTLMGLVGEYMHRELPVIQLHNIRFRTIGRINELPEEVREELRNAEGQTQDNPGLQLVIAINYSGRLELVDSINRIIEGGIHKIREQDIEEHLYAPDLPFPDLLIRTSGEMRISNFLLWQVAYSEIYVTDVLWPDFRDLELLRAIQEFQRRERRYGGVSSTLAPK